MTVLATNERNLIIDAHRLLSSDFLLTTMARQQGRSAQQQRITTINIPNKSANRQKRFRFGKKCPFLFFLCFCSLYGWALWTHYQQVDMQVVGSDFNGNRNGSNQPVTIETQDGISVAHDNHGGSSLHEGKFAYAFLLGGAMSTKPGSDHRGGLYSVVVAAHNLRRHNSTADIVLMVQMSTLSNATRLPGQQVEVLKRMNIEVIYLPKYSEPKFEKFYNLMLEKFRVLGLTKYDRVLYLDYDVMPLCNLDYMFRLSYEGVLKENVVLANLLEPSSGGFFLLTPNSDDYRALQDIVIQVENRTLFMPFPHWNSTEGWGHAFVDGDYWVNLKGEMGYEWDWYGVQADQGLLYFWSKYVKKSVSIIVHRSVEHWEPKGIGVGLDRIDEGLLDQHSCSASPKRKAAPYRDFVHLTGKKKPWHANLAILEKGIHSKGLDRLSSEQLWLWLLKEALKSIGMDDDVSLDFIRGEVENPALGITPGNRQRNMLIKNKAKVGWKQYQHDG